MRKNLNSAQIEIEKIIFLKNEGKTWKYIAEQAGSKIQTVRNAHRRHKLSGDLPPKEKRGMSKLGGRLGPILKWIAMENPSWTYRQLSEEMKVHCCDSEDPPGKDSVRGFLVKNGIIKKSLISKES